MLREIKDVLRENDVEELTDNDLAGLYWVLKEEVESIEYELEARGLKD
jgi:hypothetical protein